MALLIAGLVLFIATHSLRSFAPGLRTAVMARSRGAWMAGYGLLSLVSLILVVCGYAAYRGEAPLVYAPPGWGRHVAMPFVLLAFVALAAGLLPTGRIRAALRHPVFTAILLWAIGHLLANGDQASVILFGGFLLYGALLWITGLLRREPRPVVTDPRSDIGAVVIGVVAFLLFLFWLHERITGVSPLA